MPGARHSDTESEVSDVELQAPKAGPIQQPALQPATTFPLRKLPQEMVFQVCAQMSQRLSEQLRKAGPSVRAFIEPEFFHEVSVRMRFKKLSDTGITSSARKGAFFPG